MHKMKIPQILTLIRISSGKNAIFAELTEKEIVVQQYEMAVVHIATPNE